MTVDRASVVDVTDYPEINELTLAADVAILDYSSLRFDWALTGKPMVFFVPDVDRLLRAATAAVRLRRHRAGPLAVHDRGGRRRTCATSTGSPRSTRRQIAEFNARFNQLHDGNATERVIEAFFG